MIHREQTRTDLGTIMIHKNVIASIASLAALEVEGVKRIGGDFKSGLMEFLGRKSLLSVKVDFEKNGEVKLEVPLVIIYNFNIPAVSARVQENIRRSMEKMTDLSLRDIDIKVQGIERG